MLDGGMILGFVLILAYVIIAILLGASKPPRLRRGILNKSNVMYAGSPTNLRFENGKIYDKDGNELKPRPFKEWIEEK